MLSSRSRRLLLLIAAVAFVSHLAFGLYYSQRSEDGTQVVKLNLRGQAYLEAFPSWGAVNEHDGAVYNRAAVWTLETGVPRTKSGAIFYHAPLYAYFLAGCYAIGGLQLLSVAVPQALLLAVACFLIGVSASRLVNQRAPFAAVIGGGLVLINLRLGIFVAMLSPSLLLVFFLAVALEAVTGPRTAARTVRLAVAMALGCYTQASFFGIGLVTAGWLAWRWRRERDSGTAVAAALLLAAALAKPVLTIADQGAARDPLAQANRNILWEANNPYYESMSWFGLWERRPGNPWTRWTASAAEQERYDAYRERAAREGHNVGLLWVRENPVQYAKLCWIRLYSTLGPFTGQMSPRNRAIAAVWWVIVFPVGFWWLWSVWGRPGADWAWCAVGATVLTCSLVILEWYLRYRLPLDVVLVTWAGAGYAQLWSTARRTSKAEQHDASQPGNAQIHPEPQ